MVTTEERMRILNMVKEGKITAEEGARLLEALRMPKREKERDRASAFGGGGRAQWIRVRMVDPAGKRINANLPMSLANVALKIGSRFAPEIEGLDLDEIREALESGGEGKILEVTSDDGTTVEIFVE